MLSISNPQTMKTFVIVKKIILYNKLHKQSIKIYCHYRLRMSISNSKATIEIIVIVQMSISNSNRQ